MDLSYYFETGLIWAQITKALYRSGKTLTISDGKISVEGGEVQDIYAHGIITIEGLENILQDCI